MTTATARKRIQRKTTMTIGESVVQGLKDIAADARGEDVGVLRYLVPHGATAEQVRAIRSAAEKQLRVKEREKRAKAGAEVAKSRAALGVSVEEFAELLGASVARVTAWEAGTKTPTGSDRLLLTNIAARPKYWRKRLLTAGVNWRRRTWRLADALLAHSESQPSNQMPAQPAQTEAKAIPLRTNRKPPDMESSKSVWPWSRE